MDARECKNIIEKECYGNTCNEHCSFYDNKMFACSAKPGYVGEEDYVAIAELIKQGQTMPTPVTKFEQGKHYRFSAALYDGSLTEWAKRNDEQLIIEVRGGYGSVGDGYVPPCWCYEIEEDKPELPKNLGDDITYGDVVNTINALIDYLKAMEK